MKRLLCLSSVRLLRYVASYFHVCDSNSSYNYHSNKVKYLKPNELLVTLQLKYKCGKVIGNAVHSNDKDVVSLVSVQKMTTHDLTVMTQEVIQNVTRAGYRIVSVISDNNVVNQNMFMELS